RVRRAARRADAGRRESAAADPGAGSRARGLATGQHDLHQVQALVVAHLRPAGDFGRGAVAALAQAGGIERADPDAGAEHGAETGGRGHAGLERQGAAPSPARPRGVDYSTLISLTS